MMASETQDKYSLWTHVPSLNVTFWSSPLYRLSVQHGADRAPGEKAEGERRLGDGTPGL